MDKLQRSYQLLVDAVNGQTLEVDPPFSIEFDITRNILSSANTSAIKIYNLAENTRNSIYQDKNSTNLYRKVQLKAGYGANLPTVFKGNISHSWSVREGVNFISTIEAYDAGFAFINSKTKAAFPSGTDQVSIFNHIISTLAPSVAPGSIGSFSGQTKRGNTHHGNSAELLTELSGGAFFVDLEKAHVLRDFECLRGSLNVITSDSGLLGTPVREETIINFDMIFEPRLIIGQQIDLESSTAKNFNGSYKVISIKHRGMISDSVCGAAVTSVGLWHGPKLTVIN